MHALGHGAKRSQVTAGQRAHHGAHVVSGETFPVQREGGEILRRRDGLESQHLLFCA